MLELSRDQVFAQGTRVLSAADLGSKIRKCRKAQGLTQEDVAGMIGCSPRLIGEMEHGRGSVGFERLVGYALLMGVDLVAFDRNGDLL